MPRAAAAPSREQQDVPLWTGTDLSSGVKRHQVLNQARFAEKWAGALWRR